MGRAAGVWNWIRPLAVVVIVLELVVIFAALIVRDLLMGLLRPVMGLSTDAPTIYLAPKGASVSSAVAALYAVVACALLLTLVFAAYRLAVRWLERRDVDELRLVDWAHEAGTGTAVGLAMILLIVATVWAFGALSTAASVQLHAAVASAALALSAAFVEEVAVRGILFRVVESRLGSWVALALTAAVFGGLHLGNEGSSPIAAASIALTAGLVLGLAYMLTRRLWLAIGMHFGANLAQGAILGLPVSGNERPGLLRSSLDGPAWLTGGTFGIEASVVTLVVGLGVSVVLGVLVVRRGQVRRHKWAR